MAVKLVFLFKPSPDPLAFQMRHTRNLKLLGKMAGVQKITQSTVLGGPTGNASYSCIVEVYFENYTALDNALTSSEGTFAGQDLMDYAGQLVEILFVETSSNE